jgi:hypothetical protein
MGRIRTPPRGPGNLRRTARTLLEAVSAPFSRITRARADNDTETLWLLLASDPDGIWYSADYPNTSPNERPPSSNEEDER